MDSLQEDLEKLNIRNDRVRNSHIWKWIMNLDTSKVNEDN